MPFDQVIGNERIKEIFRLALQKRRLPQSILLADPSGSGAEKLARVLAQAVNCLQLSDDACGICANCRAIEKGIFPDVLVIEPDKEVIKVERIREAKKLAYLKPMVGRRKVFIIQQSEKMTVEAANTFLKVLEEPPATTLFILITNNPHLLLPTIRSRCQELNLSPIPRELLEKFIQDQGRDKNEARLIAYLVKGDFEEASRFNIQETRRQREASWKLVKACVLGENFSQVIRECSSYTLHSRSSWVEALDIMASFWRDILLVKLGGPEKLVINYDFQDEIKKLAAVVSLELIEKSLRWINDSAEEIKKNLNIQVIINSYLSHYRGRKNG